MLQLAAINTTPESENIAFSILKQFIAPSFPYGFSTIFGMHNQMYLPFPTSIPLVDQHCEIPTPCAKTYALLESIRYADRDSYAHATNHAAHVYNFSSFLGLSRQETIDVYYASLLHDIGKLYYMKYVQLPRKLTDSEKAELDKHSILSYLILTSCKYSDIIRYSGLFHHYNNTSKLGYPKIDTHLSVAIATIANEFGLPTPEEDITTFLSISPRQWYLLNVVSLLDSLDAAIDPNRKYKTSVKLCDVKKDFDSHVSGWGRLLEKELEAPFDAYVDWLENRLVE